VTCLLSLLMIAMISKKSLCKRALGRCSIEINLLYIITYQGYFYFI
jgi:hypothetical protein